MLGLGVCLLLLCILAMIFLVWPLLKSRRQLVYVREDVNVELYREHKVELQASLKLGRVNQQEYETLLRELDLSLLAEDQQSREQADGDSRGGRLFIVLLLPVLVVFSALWYWQYGAAQDVEISQLAAAKYLAEMQLVRGDEGARAEAIERLQALPELLQGKLRSRLDVQPNNTQYWYLLARTSMERAEYTEAQSAYQEILKREPDNSQIMAELAQARFLAAGNRIDPLIDSLVERVLLADAVNPTALGLAGISSFEGQAYAEAIEFWRRAITAMGAGAPGSQALEAGIVRAQQLIVEAGGGADAVELISSAAINVRVSIAGSVAASPDQVVFVYARAWQGGKMPLAIVKLKVSDLPALVVLDESNAMATGMGLTSVERLQLVARISQSGGVVPAAGDWQASLGPVTLVDNNAGFALEISEPIL